RQCVSAKTAAPLRQFQKHRSRSCAAQSTSLYGGFCGTPPLLQAETVLLLEFFPDLRLRAPYGRVYARNARHVPRPVTTSYGGWRIASLSSRESPSTVFDCEQNGIVICCK